MAYTSIDDPEAYFQVKLYTGNGGSQSITLDGDTDMQPDFLWIKERGVAHSHALTDAVRGVRKSIITDGAESEYSESAGVASLDSDGFTFDGVGNNHVNDNTQATVAWCWKESATAGYDIVSWTGTGSTKTENHSLSAVPHMMIFKNRTTTDWWVVYHHKLTAPADRCLFLNNTYAEFDEDTGGETLWNDTVPTSSVFTVGDYEGLNTNTETFIGYLWTAKQGYSKFGTYKGNGNDNGPFIYTGFKPAYVMIKRTDTTADWRISDNKRPGYNLVNKILYPNGNWAEGTGNSLDHVSNGFKFRDDNTADNASGGTYIYMAFAESPFVNSEGVPTNAR